MRDDIRKMIGGYATGSLSEAEQKELFEAALDDQDLFDELMREQALKEMLDQPGAKPRLMAALEKKHPVRRPLVWMAAAAMVALAVGITTFTLLRTPKPIQLATVQAPAPPVSIPENKPVSAQPDTKSQPANPKVKSPQATGGRKQPAEPAGKTAAPAAPPSPQAKEKAPRALAQSQIRDSNTVAAGGSVSGFVPPTGVTPSMAPMRVAAARFGFDYAYEPGSLTIKNQGAGTLTVAATTCFSCEGFATLFTKFMDKDSTTQVPAASSYLVFSIAFVAQADSDQNRPATVNAISIERNGTAQDPNPSPNSKILLRLELR